MVVATENVGVAMGLVCAAGAATGIGGSVVFFPSLVRLASRKTLAAALGLSSGVMVFVSFAEILIKSQDSFEDAGFDEDMSRIYAVLCFFAGVVFMIALNHFVTYLLGGHHHHHHHNNNSNNNKNTTTNSHGGNHKETSEKHQHRVHTTKPEEEDEADSSSSSSAASVPPCPCHDEHPIETLNRVRDMAESMAAHPDKPHVHKKHNTHKNDNNEQQNGQDTPAGVVVNLAAAAANGNSERSLGGKPPPVSSVTVENQLEQPSGSQKFRDEDITESSDVKLPMNKGNSNRSSLQRQQEQASDHSSSLDDNDHNNNDDIDDDDDDDDDEDPEETAHKQKLVRMSMNTALAIGLHNFPEGLATFVAALNDPKVGAVLAVAIAIHNIPEGLCVAMPIYYATGNQWKAFGWSLLSGLAEPIAGLLGWAVLANSFSDTMFGLLFGVVAGMMVIISVRELLPTAHRYDPEDSVVTYAFCVGMVVMAISLMLFMLI